ncbi:MULTISPECIES: acyl-CoA carboxylase subunit epsilon [unclassified Leifsonia]|uniref:acyl-CoA carboxylase subunit epsilon n=1 Tax=unclassified Leifsonia TaxID=2663824 RepID=UPI000AC05CAB|nr:MULTISPECIES: acyl-CoA carboxylase subunit epsilon [unclassified Leifsonia]
MGRHAATDRPDDAPELTGITFLTQGVTDEEAAAVTAVLSAMLAEEADGAATARPVGQSAWQRSQRALRQPLTPGAGQWRGFAG